MSRRSALIAGLLVVALAGLFYVAVHRPLAAQRTALAEETAGLEAQAQSLRNQIASLEAIRADELEIRADLSRLRALIPAGTPAQPSFVSAVQLAADASGATIESLTFGLPAALEGQVADAEGRILAEIEFQGVVHGGYFQVVDLFRRLEVEVARAVQVDTLSVQEDQEGFPLLEASVTGRTFALLPATEVEAPGTGIPDPAVTATPAPTAPADAATPVPAAGDVPAGEVR